MHKIRTGVLVLAAAFILVAGPVAAQTLTPSDIQNQIQQLLAKIEELRKQMVQLQGAPDPSTGVATSMPVKYRICSIIARNLAQGAEGDDVRSLQEFLQGEKYFTGTATGYFGPLTAQAVAKWQSSEGVSAVGAVGPISRERLKIKCGFQNTERFSVSPTRGDAPLTVVFSTWLSGFRVNTISYSIDFGDGSSERAADCYAPADACQSPGQNKHTYSSNGTYTATLNKITDPCPDDGDPNTPRCLAAIHTEVVAKEQIHVGPISCAKEYMPVCASKQVVCITAPCNPVQQTYGNRCTAVADGATVLYSGACRTDSIDPANDLRCKSWYDGCNTCSRSTPGGPAMCTLRACTPESMTKPYCTAYYDDAGNKPPSVSGFSGPTTLALNSTGTWTIKASDPEGGTLSYEIWWGDENVYAPSMSSAGAAREVRQTSTFTHTYANAGTYTVSVVVRDSAGAEAKTSTTVKVGSDGTACTLQYDPICGRPAGCANTCAPGMYCTMQCQLYPAQTYGNRCQLDAAGAQFLYSGQCDGRAAY